MVNRLKLAYLTLLSISYEKAVGCVFGVGAKWLR